MAVIVKTILGILIGAGIGAVIGHYGKCSTGGCPLTANPFRGAIYGAVMGALFALSSAGTPAPAPASAEEQLAPGEGLIHITTTEQFNRYILQSKMPCLVDFYSNTCPPCLQLSPTIDTLAEVYKGRVVICKINVDTTTELAMPYGIDAVPAVLFFKGGDEVQREIGPYPQATYERILDHMLQPIQTKEK